MNNIFERYCVAAVQIEAIYSLWLPLKSDKVAITHFTMEIHFQTNDHVVGAGKVPEQHIWRKYRTSNSLRVISHLMILGKCAVKSRPKFTKPKKVEEHKNSLELVIYQKYVTVTVLEETVWQTDTRSTDARTDMVQIIIFHRRTRWEIMIVLSKNVTKTKYYMWYSINQSISAWSPQWEICTNTMQHLTY